MFPLFRDVGDTTRPSAEWEEKDWGRSRVMAKTTGSIATFIDVRRGGFCSVHYHKRRDNWFQVLSGEIVVKIWGQKIGLGRAIQEVLERPPLEVLLTPQGDPYKVEEGILHQFESGTGCSVIEVYVNKDGGDLVGDDICRLTKGGQK